MKAVTRTAGVLVQPATTAATAMTKNQGLTLMGWHRIDPGSSGLSTSFDDFRRQLDVLTEWGAHVLSLEEASTRLADGTLPERAVGLTFDDGYASVLELAWPELQSRGLPATVFAVSDYLTGTHRFPWDRAHPANDGSVRLADQRAICEAADEGLHIGSHTVTHRWLPRLSDAEVVTELRDSRSHLEDVLQRPVTSFAYPMGGWNPAIRDQVERAGYDIAITVDRGRNHAGQSAHSLRRAFAFDRPTDFRRQLNGAFTWMRPIERWRSRGGPEW